MKRPATLAKIPFSDGAKPYYPMIGDRLWDKQTGQYVVVTAENKQRLPKSCVFVGSLDVGSFVKHYMDGEDHVFVIEEMAIGRDDFLLIRKTTDPTVVLYVDPKAITSYRVVNMEEDMDEWFEYY